jgi:predicted AAA+ superfamily ATPase
MEIPKEDVAAVLIQFNPWWGKLPISDLPKWKRSVFRELLEWVTNPPTHRAVMLAGPRQVGKTTLLLQTIETLISKKIPSSNILYATFDHPILKLAGLEKVLEVWREIEPKGEGYEYLFLDEAQFLKDFGTWVKHRTDFNKSTRIIFTGSACPLLSAGEESGVGRWHTLPISTLSFYEYLQIKNIGIDVPDLANLTELFALSKANYSVIENAAHNLTAHFHEYLLRGGFPQTSLIESLPQAQRLLREDIIDKVLKRDMTALFGVRRVLELEQTFIYLCMHNGNIQELKTISNNLGINVATVQNFINLLEAAYLLYRIPPFGNGKEILRARYKCYLSDPAIAPAILMKGKSILEDATYLGKLVENAVLVHLKAHSVTSQLQFSYWKDSRSKELDLVLQVPDQLIPFEVKYQSTQFEDKDVPGLVNFCKDKGALYGYILTKAASDIGELQGSKNKSFKIMKIPSSIFCYWLGKSEINGQSILI